MIKLKITPQVIERAMANSRTYARLLNAGKRVPDWTCMCVIAEAIKDVAPGKQIKVDTDYIQVGETIYSHTKKSKMIMDRFDEEDIAAPTTLMLREVL